MAKQTKPDQPQYPVTVLVHTNGTGVIGQFLCPNCGKLVRISERGRQPGQRCDCGTEWRLTVMARPMTGPSEVKGRQ